MEDSKDIISRLSEIRSQYNCFNEPEEPYYRALSEVIKMLSEQADGDTISRQAAIEIVDYECGGQLIGTAKIITTRLSDLPPAQPEYEPVTAEDFAKAMSENTIWGFATWLGVAIAIMKEQGFEICKKTM